MAEPITQVLGIVGIKNRGEYNPETTYEKLNTVRYQGQTYCAKTDTQGNLPTNILYWDLMVEKGEKGDKGDTPVKGVDYYTSADKAELERTLASDVTTEVTTQLSDLTSATPIAVSSISAMTDTTKIYVLTTNGHWYWNNGTTWVDAGVYQATELSLNEVKFGNLKDDLAEKIFKSSTDVTKLGWHLTGGSLIRKCSTPLYLKAGTTIVVSNDFVQNYKWNLRKYASSSNKFSTLTDVFAFTTETSYTLTEDIYGCFTYLPIDDDWSSETYTVDRNLSPTNDDITQIKYYYPAKDEFLLEDIDSHLLKSNMCPGGLEGNMYSSNVARYSSLTQFKSSVPIKFSVKEGYEYGVIIWAEAGKYGTSNKVSDTGWIREDYILAANKIFTYTLKKIESGTLANVEDLDNIVTLTSYSDFNETDKRIKEMLNQVYDYNYQGEKIDFQNKYGYTTDILLPYVTTSNSQGFDICNGYIVQLYNGGSIKFVNLETGNEDGTITGLGFNHGDTCQFSKEKYDASDMFPLLYITSDTTPSLVHVIRIANLQTAYKIKTYDLGEESGYYAGHCFDFDNNIIYCFGYKANSFTSANNNATIISAFDMNNETLISGITYSLELIERYEKPFIYCIQGQKFFKGKCFLLSSYSTSQSPNKIYVYDPTRKLFVSLFDNLPSGLNSTELEDLAFILNEQSTSYNMIIGNRVNYYEISFK